jgi:hypothetical protein
MIHRGKMPRKLSRTTIALIFFASTLVLSFFVFALAPRSSFFIDANRLDHTPANYSLLENPDVYTLQAIEQGRSIDLHSRSDTTFDELAGSLSPRTAFEYKNQYYSISMVYVDADPAFLIVPLAGIGISLTAAIALSIKAISNKRKTTKENVAALTFLDKAHLKATPQNRHPCKRHQTIWLNRRR